MLALRLASWIWAVVIVAVILLPQADLGSLHLSFPTVQAATFAVGAVFFALGDRKRPYLFRAGPSAQNLPGYYVSDFKRHLGRIAAMLVFYLGLLEIGRYFETGGPFRFAPLATNTGWTLLACAILYVLARMLLVGPYLARAMQGRLGRLSAAFRLEAAYSAVLRDISQAAYAACVTPSLPAEDRLERARQLLDGALAAAVPNHSKELLDTVFGSREEGPAPYRHQASVDRNAAPVSREETT